MMSNSTVCPGCNQSFDEEEKKFWITNWSYMVQGSLGPAALLARVDCHVAELARETLQQARFCPAKKQTNFGTPNMGYSIRYWWVWLDEENTMERWTIGPGGFFREFVKTCNGVAERAS